jgi:multiple sugar transport system ATP-binding protein
MAAITLEHIYKTFPGADTPTVTDVNLDIADGEFMILVGPSGCGKSTILRMIVGLEDISEGEVRIGDKMVNDLAPRERNLAMVFQNYALYPHLSVYENIAFPLRLRKASDEKVREGVEHAAMMLELTDLLDRKPSQLSGGQRQRVAMGRALVRDADAFLFDEPLSNLDAKLRGQMRTEIARIQKRLDITTVYVTHDQIEAMTLGDRVAVLRKGILQQVDSPRELYEQPVNLFVAGFIGSPPMNFMPAKVEGSRVELPIGTIEVTGEVAKNLEGHDILIAGVRPEHFEDAAVLDEARKAEGLVFKAEVDGGAARGPRAAGRAGQRARQRADPHPAGGDARPGEPGRGGPGGRAVARPDPHAPVRPGHRRQPHPRQRHGREGRQRGAHSWVTENPSSPSSRRSSGSDSPSTFVWSPSSPSTNGAA